MVLCVEGGLLMLWCFETQVWFVLLITVDFGLCMVLAFICACCLV